MTFIQANITLSTLPDFNLLVAIRWGGQGGKRLPPPVPPLLPPVPFCELSPASRFFFN